MCLVGNHLFVIFAVLDVSFAVNSCLNRSFLHLFCLMDEWLSNAHVQYRYAVVLLLDCNVTCYVF